MSAKRKVDAIDDSKPAPIPANFHQVILDSVGDFTWGFGSQFFITCKHGNFIYSDPDYNGDNTIRRTRHTLQSWMDQVVDGYGRDKGEHVIRNYVNPNVRFI